MHTLDKNNFDKLGYQSIDKLNQAFGTSIRSSEKIISPYSIGIEIEIKFRYFFPHIFKEYFEGKKFHLDYTEEEQKEITKLITEEEKLLIPKLEATVECGIPKGNDKYYEFAFNPVYDLSILVAQINILKEVGLIPVNGYHSLHISIGDLKATEDIYYVLMALELMFIDKDRIREGYNCNAWSKKGFGGVMKKNEYDLLGSNEGFEFRTLMLYPELDIKEVFITLVNLLNNRQLVNDLRSYSIELGLPNQNWRKPIGETKYIWDLYLDNFDHLSDWTKNKYENLFVY